MTTTPIIINRAGWPAYLFPDGRVRPFISGGDDRDASRRQEIADGIVYVRSVLEQMADEADAERSDTDQAEWDTRWDEGFAFVEAQRAEIDRLDRIAEQRTRAADLARIPGARVSGTRDNDQDPDGQDRSQWFAPNINVRTVDEAYDLTTIDRARSWDAQVVGRARAVIEKGDGWFEDSHRSAAIDKIEAIPADEGRGGIAQQVLLAASPEYRSAFLKYTQNTESPGSAEDLDRDERRRMQEVDNLLKSSGFWNPVDGNEARALALTNVTGKLVPSQLDTSVILTNDGSANPFRQISRVIPVATNVWTGVSSLGVTAGWTGTEGTEVDDDAPSFANPAVTCYMADAFVPISFQGYEDWTGGMAEVERMFRDGKDNLEATAFATGSGTNEPFGVVTALAATTAYYVAMATNSAFAIADLYTLKQALPDRWKPNAKFVSAEEYLDRVRQFGTANNYHGFTVDLNSGDLTRVFGKDWYQSSAMTGTLSTTTNNAIVYGDFQQYVIADRIGMVTEFVPNLFATGANRPSGQRGWLMHWRVGADVIVDRALRLMINPNTAFA